VLLEKFSPNGLLITIQNLLLRKYYLRMRVRNISITTILSKWNSKRIYTDIVPKWDTSFEWWWWWWWQWSSYSS